MAGRVLRARSIEPFERSRPWFAADADTMQIQWWEGAVPSCAGTVRERTAAGTEREESGFVLERVVSCKAATEWHVAGWRGSRSCECARSLSEAHAKGSGAG